MPLILEHPPKTRPRGYVGCGRSGPVAALLYSTSLFGIPHGVEIAYRDMDPVPAIFTASLYKCDLMFRIG